jgi:hypothetical protein
MVATAPSALLPGIGVLIEFASPILENLIP